MLQKRFNWYLNEADNVLASALAIVFDIWSLMFYRFIKNENGSQHLYQLLYGLIWPGS